MSKRIQSINSHGFRGLGGDKRERSRLLNQANDAINKMDTDELKKIVPELQGKSKLK